MQEVEGSTPTGGTCPNDFSDPIDQDIRTQWALSWKIVVSEWRSVIAVSLNVGGGVRLIKPAKLCMCTQNTTHTTRTDARRRVCAAMVPYRWATRGTSLREWEYTHTQKVHNRLLHTARGGGRVVRMCCASFQCRRVLLIWIIVGQGPIVLAVGADGVVWTFFFSCLSFLSPLPSVGDGLI